MIDNTMLARLEKEYIVVPWPPSLNNYWRFANGRAFLTKEAREYKKMIGYLSKSWKYDVLLDRIDLDIVVFPPDKRKRDLDNLTKILIDALEEAKLFIDDSQIDRINIERGEIVKQGLVLLDLKARNKPWVSLGNILETIGT